MNLDGIKGEIGRLLGLVPPSNHLPKKKRLKRRPKGKRKTKKIVEKEWHVGKKIVTVKEKEKRRMSDLW